jgi:short-subunit dehydrogenase
MMKLKDKIIVITGASQGLGQTLAQKAAQEGAKVILIARTEKLLQQVKANIEKDGGYAEYFLCDVSDYNAVQETTKQILQNHKKIDILVNGAGIWTTNEIEKTHPERRKQALEINTLGTIEFTHAVLQGMEKNNHGYIFNIISTSGASDITDGDNTNWLAYGATKWAISGFTKDLRTKLKHTKIKVTGFFPGGMDTNIFENAGEQNAHHQPWMMKPEDVADIIIFALTRPDDVVMERIIVTKVI